MFRDSDAILRALGIRLEMTVLDLCCGDGYFTAPLARIVQGKVFALDLDPVLLDRARDEVARQGTSVLQWILADARAADRLLPAPVDYVLLANAFHGVPDQKGLAATMARCLRPGGQVGILNWHARPREETTVLDEPRGPASEQRMLPEDVADILAQEGFTVERIVDVPPYHYGVIARRAAS